MKQSRRAKKANRSRELGRAARIAIEDLRARGAPPWQWVEAALAAVRQTTPNLAKKEAMRIALREVKKFDLLPPIQGGCTPAWARTLASRAKRHDRQAGRDATITAKEVFDLFVRQGGCCSVSGIPFSTDHHNPRSLVQFPFAPSLDRVDAEGGYDPANVRLVSVAANFAMNKWGLLTLQKLARGVVRSMDASGEEDGDNIGWTALRANSRTG